MRLSPIIELLGSRNELPVFSRRKTVTFSKTLSGQHVCEISRNSDSPTTIDSRSLKHESPLAMMATKAVPPPKGSDIVMERLQSDSAMTNKAGDEKTPRIAVFSSRKALWTTFAL